MVTPDKSRNVLRDVLGSAMLMSLFSAARKTLISALRERSSEDLRWMELAEDREK